MKKKNVVFVIALCSLTVFGVTGCGNTQQREQQSTIQKESQAEGAMTQHITDENAQSYEDEPDTETQQGDVGQSSLTTTEPKVFSGISSSVTKKPSEEKRTTTSNSGSSYKSYDDGYDAIYDDGDYDWDRYKKDRNYADGVDDAMDDWDDEYGEDW